MRKFIVLLLIIFSLFPLFVSADCSNSDATVIFINGILGNEEAAKQDRKNLEDAFKQKFGNQDVKFINGFNPQHILGTTDFAKSVMQAYGYESLDVDLTTILNNAHDEVKTQKIILVGHSQGTFYTNAAYEYLIKNGVSEKSIAVYNIATPDERVAGDGNYLTSSTDKLINEVRRLAGISGANKPLPANIDLELSEKEKADTYGGHSFSDVYLALASDKIIGDIDTAINNLEIDENFDDTGDGCFVKPGESLSYKVKKFTLTFADNGIKDVAAEGTSAWTTDTILVRMTQFLSSLFGGNSLATTATTTEQNDTPNVSFFNEESKKQIEEVSEEIEEAVSGTGASDPNALPESLVDILDDIAERLDVIAQQIIELQGSRKNLPGGSSNLAGNTETEDEIDDEAEDEEKIDDETISETGGSYSGNGSSTTYPKILISEVQVASSTDEKSEFIELYNPNNADVDLTGWYLQRKTASAQSYSTYASNTLFSGLKISAKGYFLIARKGYFAKIADISVDNPITKNNSFVLKNPGGDVSDKLGFGEAKDYENFVAKNPGNGQTIGRKVAGETEQDTEDNSADFELQTPTPKAQNMTYVQEPQPGGGDGTLGKDVRAPEISFTLEPVQITADFAINFTVTDVADAVSPSGVDSYIFRWQEDGGAWQQDASVEVAGRPTSVSLTRDFAGEDGKTYYFQTKANDVDGNESDWQPETPIKTKVAVPKKILINEIQVDGAEDKKEEFVELYNPNGVDVDLTGWYLQRKTATGEKYGSYVTSTLFEGEVIKANDYLLIARTGYFADLTDIPVNEPITEDNSLVLKRKDESVSDKVGWGNATDFETAAAIAPGAGKSIERKIIGGDTDNNAVDFRISEKPTPGEGFIKSGIQDDTNYENNFNDADNICNYNLSLSWNSSVSDIDFFDVQYKLNDESWQNWLTKTKDTAGNFKALYSLIDENNTYSFRVKSQDINGNQSDWQEINIDLSAPVVINEIALYGTTSSQKDNWIELYNKSDKSVDLTGWQVVSNFNKITLTGTIPAKGYFILEKGDDNVLPDIFANQIFTEDFSGSFIQLWNDKNRRIDEVYNNGNWHYVENKSLALERISPYAFGSAQKNWKLNDEKTTNDKKDRDGNLIYGTPGSKNSYYQLYTFLPLNFGRDILLPKTLSPYVFGENLKIPQDITFTIEPGSVLKAVNSSSKITVDGTIKAVGTPAEKIIFTTFFDDEYGGDANNDSDGSTPKEGNWLGIELTKNSLNSQFDYAVFRYGGGSLFILGAVIKVDQSLVSIKNSVFENNANRGIFLVNSDSVIDSNQFLNIKIGEGFIGFMARAIDVRGGNPQIINSYFKDNNCGIAIEDWSNEEGTIFNVNPVIQNNTFENNAKPIYLWTFNNPVFFGNKATGNGYNAIILSSSIMKTDITLEPDLPYFLDELFDIPENTTLTLKPGVVINPSGITVYGTLKAVGTAESPIIFRNYYWDQEGAGPGKWFGLRFMDTSKKSELENIEIFYAGNFYSDTFRFGAAVRVENCDIFLKNSYIHDNQNHGIWLQNSNSVIDNVKFFNHTTAQYAGDAKAIYIQGGSPEVKNSYFDKQTYGIILDKWVDPETTKEFLPTANLHQGILDTEKNTFINTEQFDVFDLTIIPS